VHASSGEPEFERVAFFSDAVFAIAVTLLIINVHVPPSVGTGPAAAGFVRGMNLEFGRIISWAPSFYVVARVWIGHHTLFRYLREIDARLLGLNLLFLALMASCRTPPPCSGTGAIPALGPPSTPPAWPPSAWSRAPSGCMPAAPS
jgi:Endosomal/lysosomal potassium channel TMEM175